MSDACGPKHGHSSDFSIDTHDVGFSVDNSGRHVDDIARSSVVHRDVVDLGTATCLSSTAGRPSDASVHGKTGLLSPVSTDAKTTDVNLNSLMDNDKSYSHVDSGDIPMPGGEDGWEHQ
jgi:hypothetical protein